MSLLNDLNGRHAGASIFRQGSKSLVVPHSLTEYKQMFRQGSQADEAYVFIKSEEMTDWVRKWCVFSMDANEIRYSDSPSSAFERVPMDKVVNLTADQTAREPTIKVTTTESRMQMKFHDLEEMRRWLFSFQISTAYVLTHILESKRRAENILQSQLEDRKVWATELGEEHGHYQNVQRRHSQSGTGGENRAYTLEDLGFRDANDRDVPFPSKWADQRREQPPAALKSQAVSPAIPISSASYDEEYDRRERVASSFKETSKVSPLEEMLHHASHHLRHQGSDDEDADDVGSDADSNDGMVFEMDDAGDNSGSGDESAQVASPSHTSDEARSGSKKYSRSSSSPTMMSSSYLASSLDSAARIAPKGLRWRSGHCSKVGPRSKNEDRFVSMPVLPNVNGLAEGVKTLALSHRSEGRHMPATHGSDVGGGLDTSAGYFAVYDGHCGDQAAIFLEEVLADRIRSHPLFWKDLETAVGETCVALDKEFLDICRQRRQYCGTTCVGAIMAGSSLIVFNIGDSMAVLCSSGAAIEMSDSHKPGRPDEEERVKRAGGWITEEKELYMARLHRMDLADPLVMNKAQSMNWVTIHRVCGELAVSRSIGDPDYKSFVPGARVDAFFNWPENHSMAFMADLVIPDPEFKRRQITAEDEFLVLASDGLWDVISPPEVVQYARRSLAAHKSPAEVAEELCDLSIRLGSSDNVTVVLVQFLHQ